MPLESLGHNVYRGNLDAETGVLADVWSAFRPDVVIGHPTFHNADNIGRQLADGIQGAVEVFGDKRVAFVVADGTYTRASGDR